MRVHPSRCTYRYIWHMQTSAPNVQYPISLTLAVLQRQKSLPDIGGTIQDVSSLATMGLAVEPGVHTMSDELILQISCNIFLAFKRIFMMRSGQNISHYTTAKQPVPVWNHDLIWWQNKIDTFPQDYDYELLNLSKMKIPITIVKVQMPSNPNQKSRTWDNKCYSKFKHTKLRSEIECCFWTLLLVIDAYQVRVLLTEVNVLKVARWPHS